MSYYYNENDSIQELVLCRRDGDNMGWNIKNAKDEIYTGFIIGQQGKYRHVLGVVLQSEGDKILPRLSFRIQQKNNTNWNDIKVIDLQNNDIVAISKHDNESTLTFQFAPTSNHYVRLWEVLEFLVRLIEKEGGEYNKLTLIDKDTADFIKNRSKEELILALETKEESLSEDDINRLLKRRESLAQFREYLDNKDWTESQWQKFFHENTWIFGFGLDYRFQTIFDREMTVGNGGTANTDKPKVDFLNEFQDFTVLVELKLPGTPLFSKRNKGSAGTFQLSTDLFKAYSQVLEQKAEWQINGDQSNNLSSDGSNQLKSRTRDPKVILLIGSKKDQIYSLENPGEKQLKLDTFELFRRDSRNIEILTYDELYDRADYIVNGHLKTNSSTV
jgi:hypothetical protein